MPEPLSSPSPRAVRFPVGEADCAGDLWLPAGEAPAGGVPLVILAHGLGGTRSMGLDRYAERFAAAGFAALTFDYRSFGDSGGQPRQVLSISAQLEDWRAAIDYGRALPQVDASRVAIWGTSFGGGHVLQLAADGAGVGAVIAQCPFTDGFASMRTVSPLTTLRMGARATRDLAAKAAGRPPVLAQLAGPSGSAAFMTAPDALPGYTALAELADTPPHSGVAARLGLQIGRYRPGSAGSLRKIRVPTLVLVCVPDTVAPHEATLRHLERAANPAIEVARHDVGHFAIYLGDAFEEAVADMLGFLRRTIGSPAPVS